MERKTRQDAGGKRPQGDRKPYPGKERGSNDKKPYGKSAGESRFGDKKDGPYKSRSASGDRDEKPKRSSRPSSDRPFGDATGKPRYNSKSTDDRDEKPKRSSRPSSDRPFGDATGKPRYNSKSTDDRDEKPKRSSRPSSDRPRADANDKPRYNSKRSDAPYSKEGGGKRDDRKTGPGAKRTSAPWDKDAGGKYDDAKTAKPSWKKDNEHVQLTSDERKAKSAYDSLPRPKKLADGTIEPSSTEKKLTRKEREEQARMGQEAYQAQQPGAKEKEGKTADKTAEKDKDSRPFRNRPDSAYRKAALEKAEREPQEGEETTEEAPARPARLRKPKAAPVVDEEDEDEELDAKPAKRKGKYGAEPAPKAITEQMPLNKYIAHCGECSRRDAGELVKQGKVKVNGELILEPGYKTKPDDLVTLSGKKLKPQKGLVYILLNKPKGYITTNDDPQGRRTVMDLVSSAAGERLFPVGRLDRDTSGLLLITNDGDLTQKLCHPSHEVKKVYHVTLDKPLTKADFEKIIAGVELEDGKAVVDEMAFLEKKNELGLEIHSGRNRIVRRIFESLGYVVEKLDRMTYAGLTKKNLPRGKWRFLDPREIVLLKHFKNG